MAFGLLESHLKERDLLIACILHLQNMNNDSIWSKITESHGDFDEWRVI